MKDQDLFLSAMSGVKPLKSNKDTVPCSKLPGSDLNSAQRKRAAQLPLTHDNALTSQAIQFLAIEDELAYKKDGVQQGVYKNLRLGKYELQATLNLHGQSVDMARQSLFEFIEDSSKSNVRCLLIQHGKGIKSGKAILKSYVNAWLPTFEQVLAFHSAQPFHGGNGAVYVLLKKSELARLANREAHQKRHTA